MMNRMINLSHDLKLRLLDESKINITCHQEHSEIQFMGQPHKIPIMSWYEITVDFSDRPELFEECVTWQDIIVKYLSTSHNSYKLSIGPFEGLWPRQCNLMSLTVNFLADEVYYGRKNWKDWFIGEEHASQ
jgi:hypothetical protein